MVGKEESIYKHLDFGFATQAVSCAVGKWLMWGITHEGRNRESSSAACAEAAQICG